PDGPPHYSVDVGGDMVSWSGQSIDLDPVVVNNTGTTLTYEWIAEPAAGVSFTSTDTKETTVTITKPQGDAATHTLSLSVSDGGTNPTMTDSMSIEVYDDACQAARFGLSLAADKPTDLNGDCVTDLKDFAQLATTWLDNNALAAPIVK
ncbi:MAG: hypothetical protein K9M75_11195, partial [Phycisphaerae bacterium]|nr:hypothetical protein [Phycisphaerae bacterium]